MIYVGFPAEPEGIEARRTDFNRYFRQLDNPEYNRLETQIRISAPSRS